MNTLKLTGLLFLLGMLLLSLSCNEDSSILPALEDEVLEVRSQQEVPFHGLFTTYPEIIVSSPTFLTVEIPGVGNATHLGKSDWYSLSNIYFDQPQGDGFVQDSGPDGMTFTAANGDQLFGTFIGISIPGPPENPFSGYGTFTIDNGTGRLAGYTGSGTYQVSVNGEFVGTLAWDGVLIKP